MKSKTKRKRSKPCPKSDLLIPIVVLFLVVIVIWVVSSRREVAERTSAKENNESTAENFIVSKLAKTPVKSRFTPVLIYYSPDGQKAAFAGCGSLFFGSQGEQIVTSEHLFRKELGTKVFAFRKLQPYESIVTHGIESVLYTGSQIAETNANTKGTSPDVVMLRTGDPKGIKCFSRENLEVTVQDIKFQKLGREMFVTSLNTGEKVRVVGLATYDHGKGVAYAVLEYTSISGESGTGFVDENDTIYVLKATGEATTPEDEKKLQEFFGTSQRLSEAYGPLNLR